MPKCVLCNKEVSPDDAHKAKYVIHKKCYRRIAPHAAALAEQKTGDEVL